MSGKKVLKYVEIKTGYNDNGPAWIAHVQMSRSGQSVYFGKKILKRTNHGTGYGNYFDWETREMYWVSGVKKDGCDRHWAGSGKVFIEAGAVEEYLQQVGASELDRSRLVIIPDLEPPDPDRINALENQKLGR